MLRYVDAHNRDFQFIFRNVFQVLSCSAHFHLGTLWELPPEILCAIDQFSFSEYINFWRFLEDSTSQLHFIAKFPVLLRLTSRAGTLDDTQGPMASDKALSVSPSSKVKAVALKINPLPCHSFGPLNWPNSKFPSHPIGKMTIDPLVWHRIELPVFGSDPEIQPLSGLLFVSLRRTSDQQSQFLDELKIDPTMVICR